MRFYLNRLKQNLLLGLLTLAPITLTLWVFLSIVDFLDSSLYRLLPSAQTHIPGLGVFAALICLLFFGSLARTVAGKFINNWSDSILGKVPIVRGIYNVAKQMSSALFSSDTSAAFKKVVMIHFPHSDTWSIAFVTGHFSDNETVVFVPTAPNPTSGYVLIVKNKDIKASKMSVPDALQYVISCGASAHE